MSEDGIVTDDFHIEHRNTSILSIRLNLSVPHFNDSIHYSDTLNRNCDGRFFRHSQLFCLFLRYLRERSTLLTQREAIAFALKYRTVRKDLKMLGITGLAI